jgi:hypothetical protein
MAGSGGTGGGAVDPCTGGLCDSEQKVKDTCELFISACNMLGAGGAGGAAGISPEQCNAIGTAYCTSTGAGGSETDQCTNDADQAVYDDLTYTNDDGESSSGSDAASAIASDCVFGADDTVPPEGCGDLAAIVVDCASAGTCTPKMIQDLTDCVGECTQDTIESITGSRLSDGCGACYSESVACNAAKCTTSGCSNPTSTECVECRCVQGCTPGFDVCSGLLPTGACDLFLP